MTEGGKTMVRFAKFTDDERTIIEAILDRIMASGVYNDRLDISATHARCPLRLADLLTANDFNFGHDICGIQRHLNRKTGRLENSFLPRFAR